MSLMNTLKFILCHPLHRNAKLRASVRFVKWQICSRLAPGPIVYDWVNGARFFVRAGETGLTGNVYTGLHEFEEMAFVLHLLRSEDLFVDVGANAGAYTILACAAVGARGYAFEPVPSTYERLVENVHLNHLEGRVRCINKGVGAREDTMAFTGDRDTTNHILASGERSASVIDVEMCSLDTVLDHDSPTLVKIDVEGFEPAVLKGAHETLEKETLRGAIIELNDSARHYCTEGCDVRDLMAGHGFTPYTYDPFERILTERDGTHLPSGNALFIRDDAFVVERVRCAPTVYLHGEPLF